MKFDVVVVGGGPAGSFLAWKLAEKGLKTAIVEEDPQIGNPSCCAGIVGIKGMKELGFGEGEWVISDLRGAEFYSPGGRVARFATEPQAWVIDRPAFDRELAQTAVAAGASLFLKTRCLRILSLSPPRISVEGVVKGTLESEILVGADGPTSVVARALGTGVREFFYCAQVEIKQQSEEGIAKLWLGKEIAPGFFGWAVPVGGILRAGLGCTEGNPVGFLGRLVRGLGLNSKMLSRCVGLIPRNFVSKPGRGRVLLVGDAAGQVKPLTGGGIYLGLSCSKLAAEAIGRCFDGDRIPQAGSEYSARVAERFEPEIRHGMIARELFWRLNDSMLDEIVKLLSDEEVQKVIYENFDFDHHSRLIKAILRKSPPLLGKLGASVVWKFLRLL